MVVGFVYLIWRLRGRKMKNPNLPPRWGLLFLYACLAGLSHILLDFTNNYGVRPFWPFSEKWYSWDIVFIVEPVMFGLPVLGLAGSVALFADRQRNRRRANEVREVVSRATLALTGVVLIWGLRDYEHRRAVNALGVPHLQRCRIRCASPLIPQLDRSVPLVRRSGNSRILRPRARRFPRAGS